MTTSTQPTAGTGNTTTNASGLESKGSQFTDKSQTAGDPSVSDALVTVTTQYFEPSRCDVVDKYDEDGRALIEFIQWGPSDHAPVSAVAFTPAEARALAAELLKAADGADQENDQLVLPVVLPVDLGLWAAGDDVDDDALIIEELAAARLTPGYDYEGEDVDLVEWVPGDDGVDDESVADELNAFRVLARPQVELGEWFPGVDAHVDARVASELSALRLSSGRSGRVNLDSWVAGADKDVDNTVMTEVFEIRRLRRRNRNASI